MQQVFEVNAINGKFEKCIQEEKIDAKGKKQCSSQYIGDEHGKMLRDID